MNAPIKRSVSLAAQKPVNNSDPLTPWWMKAANAAGVKEGGAKEKEPKQKEDKLHAVGGAAAAKPAAEEPKAEEPVNNSNPLTPWWMKAANAAGATNATSKAEAKEAPKEKEPKQSEDKLHAVGGAAFAPSKPSPRQDTTEAQAMNAPIKRSLSLAAQKPVNNSDPLTPWWMKAANAAGVKEGGAKEKEPKQKDDKLHAVGAAAAAKPAAEEPKAEEPGNNSNP